MYVPDEKVEIIDELGGGEVVAGDIEEPEDKGKKEADDTAKKEQEVSKKEKEEANARMSRLEQSNKRLMEIFTSPDFFAKLGKSMRPEPVEEEAKLTPEAVAAEKQRLEDMSRQEFLSHTLSKVGEATAKIVKPEIDKLATQMSTFISSQAENTAGGAVKDFISRVGQAEFDKHAEAMEIKARATRGLSIDEIYKLVSGKEAPQLTQNVIPNRTVKPGEGARELTEQKDLSLKEAGSRNFDHIFGKYKK